MTTIDTTLTVGDLATRHPLSTRVFARHGIDFCCGGGVPLHEACAARNLDAEEVAAEIRKEVESSAEPSRAWDKAPLGELIDHILGAYHQPLYEELPRLAVMAGKVLEVHRDKDEATLAEVLAVVEGLQTELVQHMGKEEQILFPMIRSGRGGMAHGPVSVMLQEHEAAGAALARLRRLTGGYDVPAAACNTWRALWHGLAALEASLHEHIHLENNILFPRALGGDS